MHKHHIIPKSRGGTDDEWNLIELDPVEHAFMHAVDYVLFDHSPQFDFRHPGWIALPEDLRALVREKHSRVFKERMASLPNPIKGKIRAYDPITQLDGFFDQIPEGYHVGVPPSKRKPKGVPPSCMRKDVIDHKDEIISAYLSGKSTVALGECYNTSARTINNWLTKWGIPKRSTSRKNRTDRRPRKTEGYFKNKNA